MRVNSSLPVGVLVSICSFRLTSCTSFSRISSTSSIRSLVLLPSRDRDSTMTVSPGAMWESSLFSSGLSRLVPVIFSWKMISAPC